MMDLFIRDSTPRLSVRFTEKLLRKGINIYEIIQENCGNVYDASDDLHQHRNGVCGGRGNIHRNLSVRYG